MYIYKKKEDLTSFILALNTRIWLDLNEDDKLNRDAMASKSTKRATVDASSMKSRHIAVSPSNVTAGDVANRMTSGQDENLVSKLRSELEVATRCIEQLRREKDCETRQVREEEQNRSAMALKELECRLKTDGRREVEQMREVVKSRLEADMSRLAGRYERTVKRLSNDLDRCRNELREEIEKRGLSSTTRGGFENERCRLLTEVRDLKAAKRRLEETVESAAEVNKQKTAELKRTQEACKVEVAKVSKEATAEIRKLLEELKAKDHQLALMDRNQYSDRGASLPKQHIVEAPVKETEQTSTKPLKPTTVGEVIDNNVNESPNCSATISNLKEDVQKLTAQLADSETEKTSMQARLDELQRELAQRNETIANLQKTNVNEQTPKQSCIAVKNQPKAVRFLLPGCTSPVLAREIQWIQAAASDDDNESICSDMSCSTSSSRSSAMSPDTTVLYDGNLEKNYQLLLREHLNLQRSIAMLLSSWTASTSTATTCLSSSLSQNDNETNQSCDRQECIVEKEAMKVAIEALKEKHVQYEQNVHQLHQQVEEQNEINEDLEFRVFELEECAEKCKLTHSGSAAEDLFEKTRCLEADMSKLQEQLTNYKAFENEVSQWAGLSLRDYVELIKRQLNEAENQWTKSQLEIMALRKQLEISAGVKLPVKQLEDLQDIALANTIVDIDDMSLCAMNCSMSTTSGFDDDNSCSSSVAELKLDDMPSEETWGYDDVEDACAELNVTDNGNDTDGLKLDAMNSAEDQIMRDNEKSTDACRHRLSESPAETVRKSDEEIWLARIEQVESRLALAIQNEQRVRDKAALLGEEKDRRIAALQEQVDHLEANEFRLSETTKSLEHLERTLQLLAASEHRTTSSQGSSSGDDKETNDSNPVIHCESNSSSHEASEMLKTSLEKLKSVAVESEAVDLRIKDSSDDVNDVTMTYDADVSDSQAAEETDNGGNVSTKIVDFETEYRELEILIKELKKVLLVENRTVDNGTVPSATETATALSANDCRDWAVTAENVSYSTPMSPECDVQLDFSGSSCCLIPERNRGQFDFNEEHLIQQIKSLKQDRDALREAVYDGEAALRETGIQLVELQSSEQSLKDEINRMRAKEEWLISRNDEQMELVSRLEDSARNQRATEMEWRSRCERHCARETELGREVENVRDELRAVETRYRRWVAQLDDEKLHLQSLGDELMEKNSDLEGREAGLLCRIRRLESAELGLRNEVKDLERSLNQANEEKTSLLLQMSAKEEEQKLSPVISSADGWTQCDNDVTEEQCRRLSERAEFFKEMLEFTEQSYAVLQSRLEQSASTETALRLTIGKYEQVENSWTSRTAVLEADNEEKAKTISELKTTIEKMKACYQRQNEEQKPESKLQEVDDSELIQVKQETTSACNDTMILSETADELDDAEMVLWATVEGARVIGTAIAEADLTSALWSNVEECMGLNSDSGLVDAKRQRLSSNSDQQTSLPLSADNTSIKSVQSYPISSQMRSQSADRFVSISAAKLSNDSRWERASSEPRNANFSQELSISLDGNKSEEHKTARDPVMDRMRKTREFWSARSISMPGHQTPVSSQHGPSSNGRNSLIPRMASSSRAPAVQRSVSEYGGPKAGLLPVASTTMPVIRSTPSPAHSSPRSSGDADGEKKSSKSYIPRPINENRPTGSDGESSDHASSVKPKGINGRPVHRETSKVYTTVFGQNRGGTSKFSHLGGSSLIPQSARLNVTDSKTNPTLPSNFSSASATNQLWRPVVSSTAIASSEVTSLPSSRV